MNFDYDNQEKITDTLKIDDEVIDTMKNVSGTVIKITKSQICVQFNGYKMKCNYAYADAVLKHK